MTRSDQGSPTHGIGTDEAFREGEEFCIAPHIEGAAGKIFAANDLADGLVVIADFKRGEAIFAEGARSVAPGLAALSTA
jgi:hypothetical protein